MAKKKKTRRPQPSKSGPALPGEAELARTIALFKAIAHPSRLLVLITLSRLGPMSAGALQSICGIEQSAMSHQLGGLRHARLVSAKRDGKQIIYSLQDKHVAHVVEDAMLHASEPRA